MIDLWRALFILDDVQFRARFNARPHVTASQAERCRFDPGIRLIPCRVIVNAEAK